ncbi:MAG: oxidoreductase, partial [Rubrivivax sp.]|nr:oxidoreductase [Rubrivivax sp.]
MKTQPLQAAADASGAATSRQPALALAHQRLLTGHQLPARWQARRHFVVLATGFGCGESFLATWDAWRRDPARCERLICIAVDAQPLSREQLARAWVDSPLPELAQALCNAWPALTPNLHPLAFDGGRVRLLLGFGAPAALLRELHAQADAIDLVGDEAPPAAGWDRWRAAALARLAA